MKSVVSRLPIEFRIMVCIVIASFLLKMILGYVLSESFFHRGNSLGALNSLAFNLLENGEFSITTGIPSIDYEPLYPMVLAVAYGLFGKSWLGVTLIQALFHAATSLLIFDIGRKLAGSLAGVIAGSYHAFYPFLLFHSLSIVDNTLFIFLCFLFVWCVISAASHRPLGLFILAGLSLGLALLARGSTLAFLPVPGIVLVFYSFAEGRRIGFFRMIVFTLALTVMVGPWVARSYYLSGVPLISTHGAFGFWQGNNSQTYEYLDNNESLDKIYRETPPELYRAYPMKSRSPVETVAVAGYYQSSATSYIQKNPKEFLRLATLKFRKFWSWNINPLLEGERSFGNKLRQIAYFVAYAPLLGMGFLGLALLSRSKFWPAMLLLGILASYTVAHMVVMGFTRARLPIDPVLMIFSSVFLSAAWDKLKRTKAYEE